MRVAVAVVGPAVPVSFSDVVPEALAAPVAAPVAGVPEQVKGRGRGHIEINRARPPSSSAYLDLERSRRLLLPEGHRRSHDSRETCYVLCHAAASNTGRSHNGRSPSVMMAASPSGSFSWTYET